MSKSQSVEEEFNVKNGGSYVTNNRQTDVIFHYKISELANFEHPYLVSKSFPKYIVGLVRSANSKSETCIKKKKILSSDSNHAQEIIIFPQQPYFA